MSGQKIFPYFDPWIENSKGHNLFTCHLFCLQQLACMCVYVHLDSLHDPYCSHKNEVKVSNRCLMWGNCILIPQSLQELIFKELHSAHLIIVTMKVLTRSYIWWSNLDQSIENVK